MQNQQKQYGFSLTEVLIAVAILAVLMGALLGLGKHLSRQSQENLCRNTLQILVAAIEQYHEFHGKFPEMVPAAFRPNATETERENGWRERNENLYVQLYGFSRSRAICEKIQKSLIDKRVFLDPWGKPLRYEFVDPGWTFPAITSAGPDGYFGDEDIPQADGAEADNISSK